MENPQLLNKTMIRHIEGIKPGLAFRLLGTFLDRAPAQHRKCMEGSAAEDWEAVEYAAHSLKSSAGHLGAERLLDVCDRLEAAARGADRALTGSLLTEFASVYELTLPALEAERNAWTPKEN